MVDAGVAAMRNKMHKRTTVEAVSFDDTFSVRKFGTLVAST